jgi:hypothetical protein
MTDPGNDFAIDNGDSGGDYLKRDFWLPLAEEGALVVFRLIKLEEPKVFNRKMKEAEPVVADFLVLNGAEKGLVVRRERILAAGITNTLRTKKVPAPSGRGRMIEVAREVGSNVACRMGTYEAFGRFHPGAGPCGPDELETVKAVFREHRGDPYSAFERMALVGASAARSEAAADVAEASGAPDNDDLPF